MNSGKEPFDGDDLVTETYRELGVEKAPEHLNQSILRMASGGGEPSDARNTLFAAWMKPVAWAATIGLSLAIVLELSELPTAPVRSDPVRSDSMPTAESMREDALEETLDKNATANDEEAVDQALEINAATSEKVEIRARPESAPNRQRISEDTLGRSTAADDEGEVFNREPKGKLGALAAPAAASQAPLTTKTETTAAKERAADMPAAGLMDADISAVREAARDFPEAKKQAAERPADSQPMASYALSLEQTDIDDLCDAAARRSTESWLTCIDKLRSAGSEEAADREYEAFILKYPVESSDLDGNK
jgi:hypothetical protein